MFLGASGKSGSIAVGGWCTARRTVEEVGSEAAVAVGPTRVSLRGNSNAEPPLFERQ